MSLTINDLSTVFKNNKNNNEMKYFKIKHGKIYSCEQGFYLMDKDLF